MDPNENSSKKSPDFFAAILALDTYFPAIRVALSSGRLAGAARRDFVLSTSSSESSEIDLIVEPLLDRAGAGDRDALAELLEQLRPVLWGLANELLGADLNQKVAPSDLFQETCIDALTGFEGAKIQNLESLKSWLVTLLVYNLIDWQRKFKKTKKRDLSRERPLYDHESQLCLLHATLRDEQAPDGQALRDEARTILQRALDRLPVGYRQVILWRNQKRLSWPKIAALIDRTPDAARMVWKRAVAKLKRELRKLP